MKTYINNYRQAEKVSELLGVNIRVILDAYGIPDPKDRDIDKKLSKPIDFESLEGLFYKAQSDTLKKKIIKLAKKKAKSLEEIQRLLFICARPKIIDDLDDVLGIFDKEIERLLSVINDRETLISLLNDSGQGSILLRIDSDESVKMLKTLDKILLKLVRLSNTKEELLELFDLSHVLISPTISVVALTEKIIPLMSLEDMRSNQKFQHVLVGGYRLREAFSDGPKRVYLERIKRFLEVGDLTPYDIFSTEIFLIRPIFVEYNELVKLACEHVMSRI